MDQLSEVEGNVFYHPTSPLDEHVINQAHEQFP